MKIMVATELPGISLCETDGPWSDEPASSAEFDRRVAETGLFRIEKEVEGEYLQPRVGTADKSCRIDRILLPSPKLISLGWKYGALGVECKASGKKLGPVLNQCFDYTRAAFRLRSNGVWIIPIWIYVWPFDPPGGDLASLMCQNRVGGAYGHNNVLLKLKTGEQSMLRVSPAGQVEIGLVRAGGKVGSR